MKQRKNSCCLSGSEFTSLELRRIVSLPVLAAFVVLGASCSQQVQQPVKKAAPPPVYVGKVEQEPSAEGRTLQMLLMPLPKK